MGASVLACSLQSLCATSPLLQLLRDLRSFPTVTASITRDPASTRRPPGTAAGTPRIESPPVPILLTPRHRWRANRRHGRRAPGPRRRCQRRRPSPPPRPCRRRQRKHGGARGGPRFLCRRDLVRLHLPGRPPGDSVSPFYFQCRPNSARRLQAGGQFAGFVLRSTKRFRPEARRFEHLAFLNFAQNVVCFVWSFLSESSLPPSRAAWLSDCAFRATSWTRGDRFRLLCVGGDCIRGFLTFLLLFQ
jgi:hypothetical protein